MCCSAQYTEREKYTSRVLTIICMMFCYYFSFGSLRNKLLILVSPVIIIIIIIIIIMILFLALHDAMFQKSALWSGGD